MARQFRVKVEAAAGEAGPIMRAIVHEARRTYERRKRLGFRPEYLVGFERQWRGITRTGCLFQSIEHDKKLKALRVVDIRLTASKTDRSSWPEAENSLAILRNEVVLARELVRFGETTIAMLSLHSIARWHQRAGKKTEDVLVRDLATLAAAVPSLLDHDGPVDIPTASDGYWRGEPAPTLDATGGGETLVYHVRTFL